MLMVLLIKVDQVCKTRGRKGYSLECLKKGLHRSPHSPGPMRGQAPSGADAHLSLQETLGLALARHA
jgi:hypothetical protein